MKLNVPKKSSARKDDRLTLRLSGKDKFALELLAHQEGITISSLFKKISESALKEGLTLEVRKKGGLEKVYIPDEAYDTLEPDRVVKLAMIKPELLTESNTVIWKVIQEEPNFWVGRKPNYKLIRDSWGEITEQARELIKSFSN